ncbi:MAG: M48 family metallopeptidase [Armatimonadota bacterium]|nr:M48 family metallopeptidase [Armatimonadota bacterium]MDR7532202.1 M48 family metallopeptidase [Armatimonadota bacterium]MDR7537223.1 M48 family metallopeptidase [Armatimonadota bacterium]
MYEAIARNLRWSRALLAGFAVLVLALGYIFSELTQAGPVGLVVAAALAVADAWGSYYHSDRLVLAASRARPAPRQQYPYLYNAVEGLAIAAGLPSPRIYLIDDSAPNAFATGRDPHHAVIVVTAGLLEKLNRLELEGVLAHEMAHIQQYDTRLMTVAAVLVGTVALLADWLLRGVRWGSPGRRRQRTAGAGGALAVVGLLLAALAPLAAQLLRLAISRQREFLADASAAMLTRYPEGLASALEKIAADREPLEVASTATAHLYIVNPLDAWGGRVNRLFRTHPPVEDRIRRLREMVPGGPPQPHTSRRAVPSSGAGAGCCLPL